MNKCKCGGDIVESKYFSEGSSLSCMRCSLCNDTLFTPEQIKIIKFKKNLF
ncbi:hypothetical protein HZC31_03110 [Candidatus Woesearchaeota archaeon]|nr:hypothetical protein [Candidatus Woesearchaeota archaeon]